MRTVVHQKENLALHVVAPSFAPHHIVKCGSSCGSKQVPGHTVETFIFLTLF